MLFFIIDRRRRGHTEGIQQKTDSQVFFSFSNSPPPPRQYPLHLFFLIPNPNAGPLDRAAGGRSIEAERGREPLVFRRKARAEAESKREFFFFFFGRVDFLFHFRVPKVISRISPLFSCPLSRKKDKRARARRFRGRLKQRKNGVEKKKEKKDSRVAPEGEARAASRATTVTGPATLFVFSFFFFLSFKA